MTLVGDAARLAVPDGEGANLAMLDGSDLAAALVAHPDDVEAALAEYEQAVFVRAETRIDDALGESIVGADAPQAVLDLFTADRERSASQQ